ncbi:hypothetical protein HYV85_03975 [Candidatus Woesearchaeota archaeon]|nr:hypothetical protein [Candidatus Woesearchaeota archaeon]
MSEEPQQPQQSQNSDASVETKPEETQVAFATGPIRLVKANWEKEEAKPQHHTQHQRHQQPQKKDGGSEKSAFASAPAASLKELIVNIYDKQYKKLLIIPAAVIIAAVVVLLMSYSSTGSFFKKDISLSGGVSISAITGFSDDIALEAELAQQFPGFDVSVRKLTQLGSSIGLVVEAGMQSDPDIESLSGFLSGRLGIAKDDFTVQRIGASLGESFFRQLIKGLLLAFVFMALTVFAYFKIVAGRWVLLPGLFVVWTAFVDIICTLAVVSLMGIHLSAAGLAAFLMLVGYSVDTDILLTMRALKGTDLKLFDRIRSAVKTGVMMTLTGLFAVVAGYFFAESETIKQIMFILSVGLVFDLVHTWITNAGLLRWYLEKRGMA